MTTTVAAPPAQALTLSLPALRGALRALSGVLPSRTTLPVLSHVWLRAYPSRVTLVASDLDTVVACWLAVQQLGLPEPLFDPGAAATPLWQALLPGRLLTELSQRLGGDGRTCRLVSTAPHVVRLVTDVGTGEVVGADHEEFPVPSPYDEASELPPPLAVPAALLAELLEQALPAAAGEKDLERPQLATVRLQADDHSLLLAEREHGAPPNPAVTVRLQAVDGSRIASSERTVLESEIRAQGGGEPASRMGSDTWNDPRLSGPSGGVLLPLRAVRYLLPLLKRHGPGEEALVDLLPADREATPNLLQVRLPEVEGECPALLVRTRLQTGTFPDLERFFEAPAPIEGEVDLGALLYHCRAAELFVPRDTTGRNPDHAPLTLVLDAAAPPGQELRLAARNSDGEHRAWLPATVRHDLAQVPSGQTPLTLGLSTGFLLDVLSTAPGKTLTIQAQAPLLPVRFKTDVPGYRALLMPMQGPGVCADPGLAPADWRPPTATAGPGEPDTIP